MGDPAPRSLDGVGMGRVLTKGGGGALNALAHFVASGAPLAMGVRGSVAMGLALPVGGRASLVLVSEVRTSSFPLDSRCLALLTVSFPVVSALGGAVSLLMRAVGFDDVRVTSVVVVGALGVVKGGGGLVMGRVGCWDPLGRREVGVKVHTCFLSPWFSLLTSRFAFSA